MIDLREVVKGLVIVLDNLRTGRDGTRYDYAESRYGSMIRVDNVILEAKKALAASELPESCCYGGSPSAACDKCDKK
jgi:hypothetical protein